MVEQSPQGQQPRGGGVDPQNKGENVADQRKPDDPTEEIEHQRDAEKWGSLPAYLESLKTRSGQPEVPERYRKYRDAFLKRGQQK